MNRVRNRSVVIWLLALTLLAAACSSSSESGGIDLPTVELEASTAVLAASVGRTVEVGDYHFEMIAEISAPEVGGAITFKADGSADVSVGALQMNLDMSSIFDAIPGGAAALGDMPFDGTLRMIVTAQSIYMSMPGLTDEIPGGAEWIAMPLDGGFIPTDELSFGLGDPTAMFADLEGAGEVTEIGQDQVRGVPTTRFRVTISSETLGDVGSELFLADVPIDVWIDEMGLIRRIEGSFEADGASGAVAMEFFDFGRDADITIPSGDDVFEFDLGAFFG